MALRLVFDVPGDPAAQGSTRAFARGGRAFTTNDPTGKIERWRIDVRGACQAVLPAGFAAIASPVKVSAVFRIRRPRSHYLPANGRRPAPVLRDDAPVLHSQDPDVDKLARAVIDALTSVVYADDNQVAELHVSKRWAAYAGADIQISEVLP